MKKLLIGAAVVLVAAGAMATQQPGNELGYAVRLGRTGGAGDTAFRAVDMIGWEADTLITDSKNHHYFHGTWSFYNEGSTPIEVCLYRLNGTNGGVAGSLKVNIAAGLAWDCPILADSVRAYFASTHDTLNITVTGDRDNTCNQYGGGSSTLP